MTNKELLSFGDIRLPSKTDGAGVDAGEVGCIAMSTLDFIEGVVSHFETAPSPRQWEPESGAGPPRSEARMYDPLTGILLWSRYRLLRHEDSPFDEYAIRRLQAAEHYTDNITMVINFLLAEAARPAPEIERYGYSMQRLRLDFEKVLTDVRSFLDSLYKFVMADDANWGEVPSSKKKRDSFGKFSEWYQKQDERPTLTPPLSLLAEIVPWALTVRKWRDNYVHHGHEPFFFAASAPVVFVFNQPWHPNPRNLPDYFYLEGNRNNLVRLDKILVYLAAPIYSLRFTIGEFYRRRISPLEKPARLNLLHAYRQSAWLNDLRELIAQNQDVLRRANYQKVWTNEDAGKGNGITSG